MIHCDMDGHKKFYEMDIWKEAFELQKEIFGITQTFPRNEMYSLTSQTNDSSESVCSNIAESHGRFHYADKIRVLFIARGELEETQSHLIVAASRMYMTKETSTHFVDRYEKLKIKLNNYISKLNKSRGE